MGIESLQNFWQNFWNENQPIENNNTVSRVMVNIDEKLAALLSQKAELGELEDVGLDTLKINNRSKLIAEPKNLQERLAALRAKREEEMRLIQCVIQAVHLMNLENLPPIAWKMLLNLVIKHTQKDMM